MIHLKENKNTLNYNEQNKRINELNNFITKLKMKISSTGKCRKLSGTNKNHSDLGNV